MSQPQNFIGGSAYHPPATPVSRTEDARVVYVPRAEATLIVQEDGYVRLNAEAARLLPEGDGTIDLRQPIREGRGDRWHLDCRPGGRFPRRPVGSTGGIKFRAAALVRLMLGCHDGPLSFELEHVGNGLFRLFPKSGNN